MYEKCKSDESKLGIYFGIAMASEDMIYYETAIKWYLKALNFKLDKADQKYDDNRKFQIYSAIKASSLMLDLLMRKEILNLEPHILHAEKDLQILYYQRLFCLFAYFGNFDKAIEIKNKLISEYEHNDGPYHLVDSIKKQGIKTKKDAYDEYMNEKAKRTETTSRIW